MILNCLVCYQLIRISRLQELVSFESPLLCARCQSFLQQQTAPTLYVRNSWLEEVLDRLNQGDICLNQLFFRTLRAAILQHQNQIKQIIVVEADVKAPYPWLNILVKEIEKSIPEQTFKGTEILIITEKFVDSKVLQISIV